MEKRGRGGREVVNGGRKGTRSGRRKKWIEEERGGREGDMKRKRRERKGEKR